MAIEADANGDVRVNAGPAKGAVAVTPDNATDLPNKPTRALYIGTPGTGTLKVTMANGDVIAFVGVGIGTLPLSVKRVWATGTDASDIVALY